MDKSWINLGNRWSKRVIDGYEDFLKFAYTNKNESELISCPCRKCCNRPIYLPKETVRKHLKDNGFLRKYTNWIYHGEPPVATNHANSEIETEVDLNVQDDMFEMLHEAMGIPNMGETDDPPSVYPQVGPNQTTSHFLKLLEGAQLPLYPGCKRFTALSFIVRMMHNKILHGWSDKSFTRLLKDLASAFPEDVLLPKSYYEARKITKDLGFTYETWDACRNNCMLFRNDDINLDECKVCNKSRWEDKKDSTADVGTSKLKKKKKKAVKQVRYFPLKPRLKRLFMSSKTAKLMRWHAEERKNDGVFRHPADSMAWKDFDAKNSNFSDEIRNVRLGLASDGFNPFRTMNIVHSTWPVIVFPYNLPPSLCMKQPFLFLSLLIDGPKGPGDKIDVYMQPLIEELLELWEKGVEIWDASSNEMFRLHASLLWTINDFPAYANLSRWSTKGQYACPCCNSETDSCWLSNGKKHSYGGHRRLLPNGHKFRKHGKNFNAKLEFRAKPNTLSGVDLLRQIESEGIVTEYNKEDLLTRKRKPAAVEVDAHGKKKRKPHNWKKKSIFFELPYWKHNLIRHNLDVMHIEKNVCDNVLWTILGDAKSKDSLNSRRDLEEMNIKNHLHLKIDESGKPKAPDAEFEMKNNGKDLFLNVIHEYRAPDGHASNISRRVRLQDRTLGGLKSHDCHILVQELIPLAIRKSLPKNVVEVLIDLGRFFKQLCSKTNCAADLEKAQEGIVLTICKLEKIFPPSFFDIMEHLPIHLAEEALIGGAVQFKWMYPIERYLFTLKEYVRDRAHPEASIAEGYLMAECMHFCSLYLNDVETKSNRPKRNKDGDGERHGIKFKLTDIEWVQAHRWILFHTDVVTPYLRKHIAVLRSHNPQADDHQIQRIHFDNFHTWLGDHVKNLENISATAVPLEISVLAKGPSDQAVKFNSYKVNGYNFRVKKLDDKKETQNSGVTLKADTMSVASRNDKHPSVDPLAYYGQLIDIVKINYSEELKFDLFKCYWIDTASGTKQDCFEYTLVNFKHLLYKHDRVGNEPFILASQAHQVYYVPDPLEKDWSSVVISPAIELCDADSYPEADPYMLLEVDENSTALDDTEVIE